MSTIRIATRGSDLALTQARYVAGRVEAELGNATEIVVIENWAQDIERRLASTEAN